MTPLLNCDSGWRRVDALTSAVNSALSLRGILDLVARHTRTLLGFDFCAVLLPDVDRHNLVITGWSGLSGVRRAG